MLGGDPRRIRMAYSLLFSLPGTPTLFYGEEIGMGEDLAGEGRHAVRTPMQWTDGPSGGFSTAPPRKLVRRVTPDGFGPEHVNVVSQRTDPDSLEILLSRGGELPTAVGRTLAFTTAWGLLYDGELTARQFVDCGVGVLTHETADSVIEPLLGRLVDAADHWSPAAARDQLLSKVGDLCISLADEPGRRVASANPSDAALPRRRSPRRQTGTAAPLPLPAVASLGIACAIPSRPHQKIPKNFFR